MDFAEFSDIETVGFATFKQKLQDQFTQDIKNEIIEVHGNSIVSVSGASSVFKECIPVVSNVVNLSSLIIDARRLDNKELPNLVSKNILARVSAKFNQALDQVGKYVNVIQGKLSVAEEQLEIKQVTIKELTAELDQMKEIFLAPEEPNSNVKRLKFQLRQAEILNIQLQKKLKACEDSYKRQSTLDLNRIKAQHERKILEHQKTLNDIIRRNKQLQDKLNEELSKKSKDDDIYTLTHAAVWVGDKIAHVAGLKDVATFAKNFAIIVEALFRGIMILGYAYTLFNTTDSYIFWLKNSWRGTINKVYALSVVPIIVFCMVKLAGF